MTLSSHARAPAIAVAVVAAAFGAACDVTTEPAAQVALSIELSQASAKAGDTVVMVGTASNPTSTTIAAGVGCSPGIGFRATGPDGVDRSLYDGIAFTCDLKDSNQLLPNETDTVVFAWRTPALVGEYAVRTELLAPNGRKSVTLSLTVLAPAAR